MGKKKGKNSNYGGVVDTKGLPYKKEEKKQSFFEKYKTVIIAGGCALLLLVAVIIGVIVSNGSGKGEDYVYSGEEYVEIDFGSYGKIVVKLDHNEAPTTVENFLSLVKDGFYDGLTIFRAQKNFVIQGGKNEKVKLDPIVGEFKENGYDNNISHKRGVISMARTSDPNSATSQFFITLDDSAIPSLDEKYAGFGYVVEGMDVVDKIANALMSCESDYMGFVSDKDAIKIVSAKVIDYNK